MPSALEPPSGCAFHPRCPLTRRLAGELPQRQTHTIVGEGESFRVVRRCVCEVPQLLPVPDNPRHCHACLLRQERTPAPL